MPRLAPARIYLFLFIVLTAFVTRPAAAALSAKAEVNPDPVQPSETIDMQITVSSTASSGSLVLRLLWPAAMGIQGPSTTGGGSCVGSCDPGELLTWNLGSLGSGSSVTVGFAEQLPSGAVTGTNIPFQLELLEGGVSRLIFTKNVLVEAASPLELAIDPKADPVAASSNLTYELVYGNAGNLTAADCELSFPLPSGTQFVSATGDGMLVGGRVVWDLGSLTANAGGRERVTVAVGALATSTLLAVEAAELSGSVNFITKTVRAEAVTRVGAQPLQLKLEVDPDPVASGELIDGQAVVSNPTNQTTGSLVLRIWWPDELDFESPITTGGGSCVGSCDAGETLVYNIGALPPFSTRVLAVNLDANNLAGGRLLPLEYELLEGNLAARSLSHTLIHSADSPLELHLDPLSDPVAAAGRLAYELTFGNTGNAVAGSAEVRFPLPAGTQFLTASDGGSFDEGVVRFDLGDLPPHGSGRRRVELLVPNLPAGSLLAVDAAEIFAEVNFLPQTSRAMAVSRIGTTAILAAAETQADPAAPNELVDTQIAVTNTGASATGSLSLRLLWPHEMDFSSPVATGGGSCVGSCDAGEYLTFNIGVLGPGASQIVSVNDSPNSGPDGAVVPFEFELLEGSAPVSSLSRSLIVDASSPLELAIDPRTDPVAAGASLVYDITYGNNGAANANGALLRVPIPPGATFLAATGDGHYANGSVVWPLGTLPANSGGRFQLTLRVPPSPANRLLEIQDARLTATVSSLPETVRAAAVSRVAAVNRNLTMTATPNPIVAGQVISSQLSIQNPGASATGTLSLRLLWPDELDFESPTTTGGGSCPGSCDQGEYLVWNLGILGPGGSVTVGFSQDLDNLPRGTLIPLEAELLEGGFPARSRSLTLLVQTTEDGDGDGEPNALDPDDDNDGMPDTWEIRFGLNPLNGGDATQDPDHDGLPNRDEFRLGYDPTVADYVFADGFETGNTGRWH